MSTLRQQHKEIYWCWKAVKQRCLNPRCRAYINYGARGITVCGEWMDFEPFLAWALGHGWEKGLDLDRIDNDRGYSPENCHFVKRRENVNNRRRTVTITVNGTERPLTEWAEDLGVNRGLLMGWVKKHGEGYAADRIAEIIKDGYKPRDYSRNHKKAIRLVDEGLVFDSIKAAAEHVNLRPCVISIALRDRGGVTRKGTFVLV